MGKHLVQKEKQEKKFLLKDKREKVNKNYDQVPESKKTQVLNIPKGLGSGIKGLVISILLMCAMPFIHVEGWALRLIYAFVLLVAILELIWDLVAKIQLKEYFAHENILLLSTILAYVSELYYEAVIIAIVFRISKIIFDKSEKNNYTRLKGFGKILPQTVNVESSEGILNISPEQVNTGDIILVEAGERIPLDGVIVEGISTIDSSAVSGRNTSWPVAEGHRVFSGCRNITSDIKVKVTKSFEVSTVKNIVGLRESAPDYRSNQEKTTLNIKKYFPLTLLIVAVVLCVSLSLLNGAWLENARRSACILLASFSTVCLSCVSAAYIKSITNASENGIFVKGSDCIESMARAETMVFDKTGIVTEGRYVITDVFPNKVSEQQLLSMAATAERFSKHPIAVLLKEAAGPIDIDYRSLQIEEIPGRGISAFVGEKQVYVGNAALLQEHGIKCAVPSRSGAAIHVAVDYKYWGHILISDRIRRGAFDSLENLRANGIKKLVLLTGDVLSVAKPLASKLNFDMLRAELKPSEKASAVEFLMANRGDSSTLAFVGDGNSEESIMSRVDVGIALGALGSDAAFSFADVLIMDRDIKKLPTAVKLSRTCYNIAMLNILMWIAVNALVIVLGAVGALPLFASIIIEIVLMLAILVNTARIK